MADPRNGRGLPIGGTMLARRRHPPADVGRRFAVGLRCWRWRRIQFQFNLLGNKGPKATYKSQNTIHNNYSPRQCIHYINKSCRPIRKIQFKLTVILSNLRKLAKVVVLDGKLFHKLTIRLLKKLILLLLEQRCLFTTYICDRAGAGGLIS